MVCLKKGLWTTLLPLVLSIIAVNRRSWILAVVTVLAHFLILKAVKLFKGRENIWMFIMVFFSTIPANWMIMVLYWREWNGTMPWIAEFLIAIIVYMVVLSIEELAMGIVTRIICPKQYQFELKPIDKH